MIIATDFAHRLASNGFELSYDDKESMEFVFSRFVGELFQRIRVNHGDAGRVVTVGAEIAIVPGRTALKGLCIHRSLVELASNKKTGWTTLANKQSAVDFSERVEKEAPKACALLASECGAKLLASTREAREKSKRYLELLKQHATSKINGQLNDRDLKEVGRIMQQPIVCIPNGHLYYERALQAIARCCGEVEKDPNWLVGRDADSSADRELMFRLQIISSRLACEPGWPNANETQHIGEKS